MLERVSSLALAGLAFTAGIAATLAVTRAGGDAVPAPAASASARVEARPTAAVAAGPDRPETGDDRPDRAARALDEGRRAVIREDIAQAERDLAEEIAAGRAAADGAPSEAEALGRAIAARVAPLPLAPPAERAVSPAAPAAARVAAQTAALVPPQRPAPPRVAAVSAPPRVAEPPRPVRAAEVVRRSPADAVRAPRAVASAEGGIMRWLNTPGPF